jgi:integral membrane protein (TIGR00529 family)
MLALLILFVLILVLIRLKVKIGLSLLAGAVFLGLWSFGLSLDFWKLLYHSLINFQSWKLVVTVILILMFAHLFENAGLVKLMVRSLKAFLPPHWVARAAPAIIGLLPMPGGAMVSAPIVREIGQGSEVSPEDYTAANYWWRHVWEASWPLYPSIILAAAVLNVSVWDVAIVNLPVSATCIFVGMLLKKVGKSKGGFGRIDFMMFSKSMWPVIFIVTLGLILNVDLIISAILVIILMTYIYKMPLSVLKGAVRRGFSLSIILLIFGVMTLMYSMEKTGIAQQFYQELIEINFPTALVAFAVPYVVGVLTGVTSAYIGVGFPIILPLLGSESLSFNAGMLLAFAGGFMGVMSSPVHLCLVLTSRYFKASLFQTLRKIAIPIALTSFISWAVATFIYS